MTATASPALSTTATSAGEAVVWRYDPWRERPRVAVLAAVSSLGLCLLVLSLRLPFVLGGALCLSSVAAFAPALARVECRLDATGCARHGLLGWERRRWEEVRRAEALPAGVLISPFAARHWLDSTRAMLLPLPSGSRSQLLAALARFREPHGE